MPNRKLQDLHPAPPGALEGANVIELGERRGSEPWLSDEERAEVRRLLRERKRLRAELDLLQACVDETRRAVDETRHQLQALRFGCPQARRVLGDL